MIRTIERFGSVTILGTDTGVGKTRVAALVARGLAERGNEVAAVKLLATGCTRTPGGGALNEDAGALWEASTEVGRGWLLAQGIEPGCAALGFEYPMAPVSSAKRQRFRLTSSLVGGTHRDMRAAARASGILLVTEGIGGVMVPVSDKHTWLDAVPPEKWGTVIVGRSSLGAINQMLLTLRALQYPRVPVAAVVLSQTDPGVDPIVEQSSFAEIASFLKPSTPFLLLGHRAEDFSNLRRQRGAAKLEHHAEIIELPARDKD